MSAFHVFPLAVALVMSAAAVAQEAPAPAPAPARAAAPSMPQGCAKAMARHDHGAEKGTPTPMSGGCAMAADSSPVKSKAKRGHDHAKSHKLM
jgi:hypothetical protein